MADVNINLDEVKAQVAKMTPEQVEQELLKIRTRQKVQQKKHKPDPAKQKAYMLKQREKTRLLKQMAIDGGFYEKINEQAEKNAEAKLEELAAAEAEDEDENGEATA